MKHEDLKKIIAEELSKMREAMPLPPEDEYESAEIDIETQRAMDMGIIPYPDGSYRHDKDEDMPDRPTSERLKDLLRDVEEGAAAVRAGEDYDFLNPDALKAAKAAMLEDPDGETDAVEDAIYAKLYYEYFPEFLQETKGRLPRVSPKDIERLRRSHTDSYKRHQAYRKKMKK